MLYRLLRESGVRNMARTNWHEEFDLLEKESLEYLHTIKILKMQNLLCDVAHMCNDEEALSKMLTFCAAWMDMSFINNGISNMRIEDKKEVWLCE